VCRADLEIVMCLLVVQWVRHGGCLLSVLRREEVVPGLDVSADCSGD
jgi:hypothetical protein